jgi:hypothetical protein
VKSVGVKFGNDQIFDMENFDEVSRRIEWSKNEFSHRLAPEPTAVSSSRSFGAKADGAFPPSLRYGATGSSAIAVHVASRRWLSFLR